eukprot:6189247-Pleurochrysis_carterae.AAC.5
MSVGVRRQLESAYIRELAVDVSCGPELTHRHLFRESRTVSGRSPTATQGRGRPSTPETDSVQGRTLIRSSR